MHRIHNRISGSADLARLSRGTVALYSGSFNPPHDGHRIVAEMALHYGIDAVLFCPHSHNRQKHAELAPMEDRLEMLAVLLEESHAAQSLYVMDPTFVESFREPASFARIRAHLPAEMGITILVGSDSVRDDYPVFLRSMDHLVVERHPGDKHYMRILGPRHVALPVLHITSSSDIRELYRRGGTHQNPRVHAYIEEKGLFAA